MTNIMTAGIKQTVILLLCSTMVTAQTYYGAGAFLNRGMSARSIGLGGACTATVNDPSSIYWNPAGVVSKSGFEIQITDFKDIQFNKSFDDVNYPQFAVTFSPNKPSFTYFHWGIGFGGSAFLVKNIDEYDDESNYIRSFNFGEYATFLSFGIEIQNFRLGISYKYLEQNFGGFYNSSDPNSNKKGVDFGLQFRPINFLSLGVIVRDSMRVGMYDVMPRNITMGIAISIQKFVFAVDYKVDNSTFSRISSGLELNLGKNNVWKIRAGIKDIPIKNYIKNGKELYKLNSKGSIGFGYIWFLKNNTNGITIDLALQQEVYPSFRSPLSRIIATTITIF